MNAKLEKLRGELFTQDDEKFQQTIERLMDQGTLDQIPLLFNSYFFNENRIRKHRLFELMASVVKKGAEKTWIQLLKEQTETTARRAIVQIMWNSRLNFAPFLIEIVALACLEDELTGVECLTLIENMESPYTEETIMDAKVKIIECLNQNQQALTESKKKILHEILTRITAQENHIF
ncbi:MAG: hypothetical protein ACKO4K_04790 [Flavobacteriales bacterium]|jgi:hypothetical protein